MQPAPSDMPQSVGIQQQLTAIHIREWNQSDFLTPRWWMLLAMILISVVAWWLLLDKARLKETCLFAVLATMLALSLVEYGDELILWDYPTDLIPVFPPLTSINLFILPLVFSILHQSFSTRKSFFFSVLASSAIICFVIEPLLSHGDFYELVNWHYYLSFPVYVALAMAARGITAKSNEIALKNRRSI